MNQAKANLGMELRKPAFRDVIAHVSRFALRRVLEHYKKVRNGLAEACTDAFTTLSGLPYTYRVKARMDEGPKASGPLRIKDIHPH